jgi:hypothetical protein
MHLNRSRIQSTSARVRWSLVAVASAIIAGHATPSGQGKSVVVMSNNPIEVQDVPDGMRVS